MAMEMGVSGGMNRMVIQNVGSGNWKCTGSHLGTESAACNFLYSHVLTQYDSKDLNVVR